MYLASTYPGISDSTDTGKIFIRDLYNMRLPAEMVVLSACETGIGEL
ncbi:MAG: CHAT domain-containing protein, partial [Bacteroidetes bacterium]